MKFTDQYSLAAGGGRQKMPVMIMLPAGEPPTGGWPGVIVLHEVFGLQPDIIAVGERFNARGWAVIVPSYLEVGTKLGCLFRIGRELRAGRPGPITNNLAAIARHFGSRPDVNSERVAVIGFCMGGGLALLLGTIREARVAAVSASYADVPAEEALMTSAPVVASYGNLDAKFGPLADVLRSRLQNCRIANDVKSYDSAGHAFMTNGHHPIATVIMASFHAGYVDAAAQDAWERVFAWLDHYTADRSE